MCLIKLIWPRHQVDTWRIDTSNLSTGWQWAILAMLLMFRKPPQNHTVYISLKLWTVTFLPASSICMLAAVTCDKWSLISSGSVQLWSSFLKHYRNCTISPIYAYKTRSGMPSNFHLHDISKWWVLPGFRISTKAGVIRLPYPKDMVTHQNILLPIITHIRWFYWHSWTECWGDCWTGVAHSDWGCVTGGLGTRDTFYGSMALWY